MHKYCCKDWLEGRIDSEESLFSLYMDGELSLEEHQEIIKVQEEAFLKRLKDTYEIKKKHFIDRYNKSLVQEDLINTYLINVETSVQKLRTEHPDIVQRIIMGDDGRSDLTSTQAAAYLSFDPIKDKDDRVKMKDLINYQGFENTPLEYIVKVNLFKWLRWFKNKQSEANIAPEINLSSRYTDEEIEKVRSAKQSISYKWKCNPEKELPELYELMKGKFISGITTLEQFTSVFTAQLLKHINPIRWHEDNASELLYFILQVEETESIETTGNRADYKKLTACFVKPDGSEFDSNFKSLKQSINTDLARDKQKAIQKLLKTFQ